MNAPAAPLSYNPALQRPADLIATFAVRHAELAELLDQVRAAPTGDAAQHILVIGARGMGKTTLIHRLAYAVEADANLRDLWQPVRFDEEHYNVASLGDFWLDCLDMLALATRNMDLRQRSADLGDRYEGAALEEAARGVLKASTVASGRRLLLLVDNLDAVLERIDGDVDASRLRETLQQANWLMLIGTSSRAIESTWHYDQPFYEMFRILDLGPIGDAETLTLLRALAAHFQAPKVTALLDERPGHIQVLRLLMGGNIRRISLLFSVLREAPNGGIYNHLTSLLDRHTALYRDRLDTLPKQGQQVFHALAQRWDPATALTLAQDARLARGVTSGQLSRLIERALVQKVALPGRAMGYQIKDRFFGLWCLMRGGRRREQRLRWLVRFLELFYARASAQAGAEIGAHRYARLSGHRSAIRAPLVMDRACKSTAPVVSALSARGAHFAHRLARALTRQTPQDAQAWLVRALVAERLGDRHDQGDAARRAMELEGDDAGPAARACAARAELSCGNFAGVLHAVKRGEATSDRALRAWAQLLAGHRDAACATAKTLGRDAIAVKAAVLAGVGLGEDAAELLLDAASDPEIAPGPICESATLIMAHNDGAELGFTLRAAIARLARRTKTPEGSDGDEDDARIALALVAADARLGRIAAAIDGLTALLSANAKTVSRLAEPLWDAFCALIAKGQGADGLLLDVLDAHDLRVRWRLVADALEIRSGRDPDRLRRLAPEAREVTQLILVHLAEPAPSPLAPPKTSAPNL